MSVKYPHVHVQLTGTDGNAFALIGKVRRAISRQVGADEAAEFLVEAHGQTSYDNLLAFLMQTVDVS